MHPYVWEGVWDLKWYKLLGVIGAYVITIYNDLRASKTERPLGYRTEIVVAKLKGMVKKEKFINTYKIMEAETFVGFYMSNIIFNRFFSEIFNTNANYFGTLAVIPLLWVLLSVYYGHNPLKKLDFMTPCLPFYLVFAKVACFMAGCCRGIPWEYGPYNEVFGQERQVPVQLIEAVVALILFFVLNAYKKKAKDGMLFPIYLILYSITRFFIQFLRATDKILGPLDMYHILSIAGLIYGIVLLFVIVAVRNKVRAYYDKKYEENVAVLEEINAENKIIWAKREKEQAHKQREKERKKMYSHSRKL